MTGNVTETTRQALNIDPLKTCQPLGAIYAALGVHACLPLSHGSSGCCRFQKEQLGRHLLKTIRVASTMLKENAAIFGGKENLISAIKNIFENYDPEIIAAHSTCLSETIGDDIEAIVKEAPIPMGKYVVAAVTPSYVASHITGYANMAAAFINQLVAPSEVKKHKAFIIPGFINPGDVKEIKRLTSLFSGDYCFFPDISDVFNTASPVNLRQYPEGGTPVQAIINAGECRLVISLGHHAASKAASVLSEKTGMEHADLDIPIGIEATDRYLNTLYRFYGQKPSTKVAQERAQLVDVMIDAQSYLYEKRVALFCDPDIALPMSEFLSGAGMIPAYVFTGPDAPELTARLQNVFTRFNIAGLVKSNTDLYELEEHLKNDPVNLLIGDVHGKRLARRLDIPFMRLGFPISDRLIHPYLPVAGYQGGMRVLEMVLNALLERYDRDSPMDELSFAPNY